MLFTMLTGRIPFQSYHLTKHDATDARFILEKIISGEEFDMTSHSWNSLEVSPQAKSVIRGLLTLNPRDRLTISQLLEHPWLVSGPSTAPLTTCGLTRCQCNLPNDNTVIIHKVESNTNKSSTSSLMTISSFGGSIEESKPKLRTIKMKIKKKKSRKKNSKNEFEVELNSELEKDLKLFRPSCNSAYDSGVQSLSSQYGITSGSTSSTGSIQASIFVSGSTSNHPAESHQVIIDASKKFSTSSSKSSSLSSLSSTVSQLDSSATNRALQSSCSPRHCSQQSLPTTRSTIMSLADKRLPRNIFDVQTVSQYGTQLDCTENKVTAYLATLNNEPNASSMANAVIIEEKYSQIRKGIRRVPSEDDHYQIGANKKMLTTGHHHHLSDDDPIFISSSSANKSLLPSTSDFDRNNNAISEHYPIEIGSSSIEILEDPLLSLDPGPIYPVIKRTHRISTILIDD